MRYFADLDKTYALLDKLASKYFPSDKYDEYENGIYDGIIIAMDAIEDMEPELALATNKGDLS